MRRQLLLLLSEQLHRKRRAESRDRLGWPESAASQQGQQSRLSDEEETYRSYRVAFVRRGPPRSVALFLLLLHSVSSALYGSLFLRLEFERVRRRRSERPPSFRRSSFRSLQSRGGIVLRPSGKRERETPGLHFVRRLPQSGLPRGRPGSLHFSPADRNENTGEHGISCRRE